MHDVRQEDDDENNHHHPDEEPNNSGDCVSAYCSRSSHGPQLPGVTRLIPARPAKLRAHGGGVPPAGEREQADEVEVDGGWFPARSPHACPRYYRSVTYR